MKIKYLAQGNRGSILCGLNSQLIRYKSDSLLPSAPDLLPNYAKT